MVTTNDDPPEFPDEISTSSKKAKLSFSLQPCRISSVQFLEELLYEKFVRLPVKSLIRFRCLSKGMRLLIDSPIFIKNHNIHRSVKSERDRSLSDFDDEDEEYAIFLYQPRLQRLFSLSFDKEANNNLNRAKSIELNRNFLKAGMTVMGWCCNGIFCFKNRYSDPESYVFWNPSNGTFRKVDCSSRLTCSDVSMGYDYVNDDYKIIRIIHRKDETSMDVYSFRKDSWRKFPMDFPSGRYGLTRGVCVRGVMHWMWTIRPDKSIFIAAFDLATETFTSLPLPLEARQLQLRPSHFIDFRGRLCIIFLPPGYPLSIPAGGLQTMWVMEKYGVESSWTKLYNFDRDIINFYFPNSRRRLLCQESKWMSWWDPEDGSFERIEMNPELLNDEAFLPELYFYDAYVYVRNLVRLDQCLV